MGEREPAGSSYFFNERREMLDYVPYEARRILEMGCGEGVFGRLIRSERGSEVWGVELQAKAAAIAREHLDRVLNVDCSSALALLPKDHFDCVVFNDILEHLENPWDLIRQVSSHLCAGGCVVASIPNVRYAGNLYELLLRGDWRYRDDSILDRTHLRFFTKKSIRRMFEDAGYTVRRLEGINPTKRISFHVLDALSLGLFHDCRFLQFACVADPRR